MSGPGILRPGADDAPPSLTRPTSQAIAGLRARARPAILPAMLHTLTSILFGPPNPSPLRDITSILIGIAGAFLFALFVKLLRDRSVFAFAVCVTGIYPIVPRDECVYFA